ncbi:hypothetical protein SynA1825c_02378 [Synechococcus sp. A18-25c]|nr:hypothetical protein SynA1825c_02378 [Synechococcus sp. A18-25c]
MVDLQPINSGFIRRPFCVFGIKEPCIKSHHVFSLANSIPLLT